MTEQQKIRVLLVDDHAVVRKGLKAFLKSYPDLECIGEACDGEEAITMCRSLRPDVVLMDLLMPKMSGEVAIQHIKEEYPEIHAIALTSFNDQKLIQKVLQSGAIGYLLKNATGEELAQAIRAAMLGQPTLAPEAAKHLINRMVNPNQPGYDLTPRELEILHLMAEGLNNPEIAGKLSVSRSTVKFHVSNILSKLGTSSRVKAIAIAIQNDLIKQA
ncbi:MAG: response regulator transcription factor [Anaerolineaceae bacterium]|nr:response regulator transcription factor [Anaerolineaceae bacterium]